MKIRAANFAVWVVLTVSLALAQSDSTNYWKNLPKGAQVYGYFEGRTPCQTISRQLGVEKSDECHKVKWSLILFRDPATGAPTTYALGGLAWRNPPKTGRWSLEKGTPEHPNADVIVLASDNSTNFLSFQKADDNVLFFLDHNRRLLVGDEHFGFTLNRAEKQ